MAKLPFQKNSRAVERALDLMGEDFKPELLRRENVTRPLEPTDLHDVRATLLLFHEILWCADVFGHEIDGVPLFETKAAMLFQSLVQELNEIEKGHSSEAFRPSERDRRRRDLRAGGRDLLMKLRLDAYAAVQVLRFSAQLTAVDARKLVGATLDKQFNVRRSGGTKMLSGHGLSARSLERKLPVPPYALVRAASDFALRAFRKELPGTSFFKLSKDLFEDVNPSRAKMLVKDELIKTATLAKPQIERG